MKRLIMLCLILNSTLLFCNEKKLITKTMDKKIYNKMLHKKYAGNLFTTEEHLIKYIDFLIKNNLLFDNNLQKEYTADVFDEGKDWLIFLYEKNQDPSSVDTIIDYLDYNYDYVVVINKNNGEIKSFLEL